MNYNCLNKSLRKRLYNFLPVFSPRTQNILYVVTVIIVVILCFILLTGLNGVVNLPTRAPG